MARFQQTLGGEAFEALLCNYCFLKIDVLGCVVPFSGICVLCINFNRLCSAHLKQIANGSACAIEL